MVSDSLAEHLPLHLRRHCWQDCWAHSEEACLGFNSSPTEVPDRRGREITAAQVEPFYWRDFLSRSSKAGTYTAKRITRSNLSDSRSLLPCAFVHLAGDFDSAQAVHIFGDAAVERFGDALAVFAGGEAVLVGGVADERNFGEDRGHVGADQNNEGSFLYSAIANGGTLRG